MYDAKLDNQLNLALTLDDEELEKTEELSVGYEETEESWRVIVKINGDEGVFIERGYKVNQLIGGYAIMFVPKSEVEILSEFEQIEYVEKPKSIYYEYSQAISASCFAIPYEVYALSGEGVYIGIVDSGIDYFNPLFINENQTSKIYRLWDQNENSVYTYEDINLAIQNRSIISGMDQISGHGTAVAGIIAQCAPKANFIVVKLKTRGEEAFSQTAYLMEGIDYILKQAREINVPVSINISYGNSYGSHDGFSLLETYIDQASNYGRNVISIGTGNEGAAAGHTSGKVDQTKTIELAVTGGETGFSVQLWKSYNDLFDTELIAPNGETTGKITKQPGTQKYRLFNTQLYIYYGEPSPYSVYQEVFFEFAPVSDFIGEGVWRFILTPINILNGEYNFWLSSAGRLIGNTQFLEPNPMTTLTIPSTARSVISVGAYDSKTDAYANFSGRGYTRQTNQVKPDIVAPGVGIEVQQVNSGTTIRSGTSFATPFVTGAAALLMEWGIVKGNDPFLYGEKVKAYLIRGARQLPEMETPNPMTGWGALCVEDSLPV